MPGKQGCVTPWVGIHLSACSLSPGLSACSGSWGSPPAQWVFPVTCRNLAFSAGPTARDLDVCLWWGHISLADELLRAMYSCGVMEPQPLLVHARSLDQPRGRVPHQQRWGGMQLPGSGRGQWPLGTIRFTKAMVAILQEIQASLSHKAFSSSEGALRTSVNRGNVLLGHSARALIYSLSLNQIEPLLYPFGLVRFYSFQG